MAFRVLAVHSSDGGVTRPLLLLSAIFFLTICVALWATGGFATSMGGLRVSARSPNASALAAALAFGLWLTAAWRARTIARDLSALDAWLDRRATAIVATVAGLSGAIAVRYSTFSAGGADPSGYLSEAAMLAAGRLSSVEPLALMADWPDAARTLAPLGWQAADGATQVPTYAVGLPLLMAVPHALGGAVAASLVVCLSGALAVWFAGRTAQALAGGAAGVLAAVALATVPVHLFESMQPMSDVPVTTAWLACWWWVARTAEKGTGPLAGIAVPLAGVAAAAAVLVRPNLAPLAAVPALFLLMRPSGTSLSRRAVNAARFAIPVAVAGALVAYLQWRWFGSPLRSGYGSATEIYSIANVAPNVTLYLGWLLETHGAWLLAAPLALLASSRAVLRWMLAFAALVCFAYFIYGPFEAWPYLRFLLPALAVACIATAVAVATGVRMLPRAARAPLVLALVLAVAGLQVARARELGVFTHAARQSRAALAGRYLASAAPERAVLITGEQSGAMRYYTGRSIVRWDLLQADALSQVAQRLGESGHEVWIVLDDWEAGLYREKFRSAPHAGLDWPPTLDAGLDRRTQAWRLRDRARFLAGAHVFTDRLR
jgi:hypothetical protein